MIHHPVFALIAKYWYETSWINWIEGDFLRVSWWSPYVFAYMETLKDNTLDKLKPKTWCRLTAYWAWSPVKTMNIKTKDTEVQRRVDFLYH